MGRESLLEPRRLAPDRVGVLAALEAVAQDVDEAGARHHGRRARGVELAVAPVAEHQPVLGIVERETVRQGLDRRRQPRVFRRRRREAPEVPTGGEVALGRQRRERRDAEQPRQRSRRPRSAGREGQRRDTAEQPRHGEPMPLGRAGQGGSVERGGLAIHASWVRGWPGPAGLPPAPHL
jgi:hypothetical protein